MRKKIEEIITMSKSKHLERVYKAKTKEDIETAYDDWAQDYEQDVINSGYATTAVMTGLIGRYIRHIHARICEAGVGTGILGENLNLLGYTNIDGFDISKGMLKSAEKKGVYKELKQMALGRSLLYPSNQYEAVLSMGTFTLGHAPASGFDELIRITKPKGILILSLRIDKEELTGFLAALESLEKHKKWKALDRSEIFMSLPLTEPEVKNRIFVYEKR